MSQCKTSIVAISVQIDFYMNISCAWCSRRTNLNEVTSRVLFLIEWIFNTMNISNDIFCSDICDCHFSISVFYDRLQDSYVAHASCLDFSKPVPHGEPPKMWCTQTMRTLMKPWNLHACFNALETHNNHNLTLTSLIPSSKIKRMLINYRSCIEETKSF